METGNENKFLPVIFGTNNSGLLYFKHIFIALKEKKLSCFTSNKTFKNRGFTVTGNDKSGNNPMP